MLASSIIQDPRDDIPVALFVLRADATARGVATGKGCC
jgi:hypothetical protein